jgi:hypothetical protein
MMDFAESAYSRSRACLGHFNFGEIMGLPFKIFVEVDGVKKEVSFEEPRTGILTLGEMVDLHRAHGSELEKELALIIGRQVMRTVEDEK